MPWCDTCDVYLAPESVADAGTCPTCDQKVDGADANTDNAVDVPWHFWIVVAALVAYLGWRLIEAALWVGQQF